MNLRVVVIEPAGQLRGSERALIDLIASTKNVEFAVCCPPETPLLIELRKRHIKVFPSFIADLHRKSRWQRLRAAIGVIRTCLEFKPDVLHVNQAGAYRVTALAARMLGLPIVCHVRLFDDAAYLAARRPHPSRLKAIIAVSAAVRDEIVSHPALADLTVQWIYDTYAGCTEIKESPPKPGVPGRIACVGRIVQEKGQDILLDALKLLATETECLIIGNGNVDYLQQIRKRAPKEEHVRVQWTGFVPNVVNLLQSCSILVCPSHRETLGRVILEGWEAGALPIVYAGSGGAAEIVAAADGGILYHAQTPECLARSISDAMALDGAERDRLIANGRAWMTRHCASEPYGRAMKAVLEQASN